MTRDEDSVLAAVQEEARKEVLAAVREEVQRVVLAVARKEAKKAVLVVRTEDADCMNFPGRKSKFRRAASIVPEKFYWT